MKFKKILLSILLATLTAMNFIPVSVNAGYNGYSVQSIGNNYGGYTPYGYTQIINQTLNPNYDEHFQMSYKTELLSDTSARVYLYTHGWISTNTALGYALALSVSLNGTNMTPSCNAGVWNGATQYGIIVNSNNQNGSVPTDKRLGAYDNGDGTGAAHSWDILYTFDVAVGASDTSVSLRLGKNGSGFFNLGSICGTTYTLALPQRKAPEPVVQEYNLTVKVTADEGSTSNTVTLKVDNQQKYSEAIASGSNKTIKVKAGSSYEVSYTNASGYTTAISSLKGTVNGDVVILISNTKNKTPEPAPSHQHSYGDWIVIKNATCTENGSRKKTCSCGDTVTEEIKALGHSYQWQTTKEATTTVEGQRVYKCTRCGNIAKTETIPKKSSSAPVTPSNPAPPSNPTTPVEDNKGGSVVDVPDTKEPDVEPVVTEPEIESDDDKIAIIQELKDNAIVSLDKAFGTYSSKKYSTQNWKKITSLYDEIKVKINDCESDSSDDYDELINDFISGSKKIEKKKEIEPVKFTKKELVIAIIFGLIIAVSVCNLRFLLNQKKEILSIKNQ